MSVVRKCYTSWRNCEIESALSRVCYLWFYTRVALPFRFTRVCIAPPAKLRQESGCCGIRTSDVTQAWWPPSGTWDLKPQQRGLISACSMDKSTDTATPCGSATCCLDSYLKDTLLHNRYQHTYILMFLTYIFLI